MVAHTLVKHARNLINDVFWIEDTSLPAEDALYYDSLHINEWSIGPPSKKKKKIGRFIYNLINKYLVLKIIWLHGTFWGLKN